MAASGCVRVPRRCCPVLDEEIVVVVLVLVLVVNIVVVVVAVRGLLCQRLLQGYGLLGFAIEA